MLDEERQLPAVAVGRANLHGGILAQQVTSLSPGRSHAVFQDALQGDRPLGTASHRSQSIRPPRDLYEEAGRPAFEGKLCGFSQDSRAYRIYSPAMGTVVESRNVTVLETTAYSVPLGVTSEDYHYEGDVLRYTSALNGPLMVDNTFDREDFCSTMEQEARMQHLGQEVRRLSRVNATYRELLTSLQPLFVSPGVAPDNCGVASPSIVPGTTGEPEDTSPGAAPTAPTTPAAANAPTTS